MNFIVGKQPLDASKAELLDLMSSRTGISSLNLNLIIDAFSFFIRKRLLEEGFAYVHDLGKFFVRPYVYKLYHRRYHVIDFVSVDNFKERLKGTRKGRVIYCKLFRPQLKIVAKMFGLKQKDAVYLYCLYLFYIPIMLKKYKEFRINRIGCLKLIKASHPNTGAITKWNCKNISDYNVTFVMCGTIFRELNKKTNQFFVDARLKQMLYVSGVSREITRKEFKEGDDYKKAPIPRY